ncbi:MAG TPA: IPT/TIG domain-containing protein [Acidimicrobiales bacterium]|nr:IPT/TIG domain-containing protein [Acidimicrobiales bacterium]
MLPVLVALGAASLAVTAISPMPGSARPPGAEVSQTGLATAGQVSGDVRYALSQPVCPSPGPGRAACLAVRRIEVSRGTQGAEAYVAGAGPLDTGANGGLSPADLASAYSYSPTATGQNQTVALVDAYNDPDINGDLQQFDAQYALLPCSTSDGCLAVVNQNGGSTLPKTDTSGSWETEESLDVEVVHSVCEQCKILLVEADSPTPADLAQAEDAAVTLGATEVSNSWGIAESEFPTTSVADFDHPGIVVTAAAGDDGYYSYDTLQGVNEPDAPASFGTVVAVGGTSLYLNGDGARSYETVWNDNGPEDAYQEAYGSALNATGGGCSNEFAAPTWQTSLADWAATGCESYRLVADVSVVGDDMTGFDTYDSYGCTSPCTGWQTLGGTSLSAPIIAAMFALAGGAHGTSYPAQTLYSHLGAASLYDVESGGDGWCDGDGPGTCGDPNTLGYGIVDCDYTASGSPSAGDLACDAADGYDGPSGVGTPNGIGAFIPSVTNPVVTAVSPENGPASGGTTVTINGYGLSGATGVSFGGTPAASFTVVDDGEITAVSPPGAIGTVDVTVTTSQGGSMTGPGDRYTYTTPPTTTTAETTTTQVTSTTLTSTSTTLSSSTTTVATSTTTAPTSTTTTTAPTTTTTVPTTTTTVPRTTTTTVPTTTSSSTSTSSTSTSSTSTSSTSTSTTSTTAAGSNSPTTATMPPSGGPPPALPAPTGTTTAGTTTTTGVTSSTTAARTTGRSATTAPPGKSTAKKKGAAPPHPNIAVVTKSLRLTGKWHYLPLGLRCQGATCAGTVKVVLLTTYRRGAADKTKVQPKDLVAAAASYRLAAGRAEVLRVGATSAGWALLDRATRAKPIYATVVASVKGGKQFTALLVLT